MLNAAQIEITGKPLGFLNPFLYQVNTDSGERFCVCVCVCLCFGVWRC